MPDPRVSARPHVNRAFIFRISFIAALGGAGTLYGPLVGAAILIPLQTATNTWFGGGGSGLTYILYGGIIVLIARFEPGGVFELWHHIIPQRWRSKLAA